MKDLKRYAELEDQTRVLEAKLKAITEEQGQLEERIVEHFIDAGATSVAVGGYTVYLDRKLYAGLLVPDGAERPAVMAQAVTALRRARLGFLVDTDFNAARLSAYVRELAEGGKRLSAPLQKFIKVSEVTKVRARKAAAARSLKSKVA